MPPIHDETDASSRDEVSPVTLVLLARLARRGAFAVVEEGPDEHPAVALFELRQTDRTRIGLLAWSAFSAARDAGLIMRGDGDFGWRLSATGRAVLRRARARTTQERATRAVEAEEATSPSSPQRNDAESPLAWLHHRLDKDGKPLIDQVQFDAGERLRADLFFAQMTPRVTSSWSDIPQSAGPRVAPGTGLDMSDRLVAARQRVASAISAVGPDLAGILIDVCAHLQGLEAIERREKWPQRSAKLVLQKALNALARHYGLLPPESAATLISRSLRHWGTEDFRPRIQRVPPSQAGR